MCDSSGVQGISGAKVDIGRARLVSLKGCSEALRLSVSDRSSGADVDLHAGILRVHGLHVPRHN